MKLLQVAVLLLAAIVSSRIVGETIDDFRYRIPEVDLSDPPPPPPAAPRPSLAHYSVITENDIFNPPKPPEPPPAPLPPLNARVIGTALEGTEPVAVIEDSKGAQNLFRVGQAIDGRAIKRIGRDDVVLDAGGREERLKIPIPVSDLPHVLLTTAPGPTAPEAFTLRPASETEVTGSPVSRLPRAEPVFRDRRPVGLRLAAIPKRSLFQRIGLRNGDVVTRINGKKFLDPIVAARVLKELKEEPDMAVHVLRGEEQRILPRDAEAELAAEEARTTDLARMIERSREQWIAEVREKDLSVARRQLEKRWVPPWEREIRVRVLDLHDAAES